MFKEIILASNNKGKLIELKNLVKEFDISIKTQREAGFDIEVDETGETFKENALIKADVIHKLSKMPVIADDSGLEIDFLDGKPGVYSHRFAGENATDEDRINKILTLLKDVPDEKRTARFKCFICYIDENDNKHFFDGVAEGKIGFEPKGSNGFGYDPIFICENGKTFSELTNEEKNQISHRGNAMKKLCEFFKTSI